MSLSMGALGGFLQVGPHYFPPRPEGAQVIMRGPHGQRLAADPVFIRGHNQPRGSGFRFWSEQMNVPADVKWNPQQVVTGVMGMGSLGEVREASAAEKEQLSKAAKDALRTSNTCVRSACKTAEDWATSLRNALRAVKKWESPSVYARAASLLTLPTALLNWKGITLSRGYDDWHSIDVTLHAAQVAAAKRAQGKAAPAGARDPAPTPGDVGWGSVPHYVPGPGDLPNVGRGISAWWKRNWKTVVLVGAGVVVFYGAGSAVGKKFAAKVLD